MNLDKNVFTIFTGDNKVLNLKAVYLESGDPLDITTATEIVVSLPLASGLFADRKLTLGQVAITGNGLLGKFSAPVPSDISLLMNPGALQDIDVTFTIGGAPFTVRYYQALTVLERD